MLKNSLRYFIFLFLFLVIQIAALPLGVSAQTVKFSLPLKPAQAELNKNNLKWVKSKNDFDQTKFATADDIDKEIEKIIKSYDKSSEIVNFEVPINSQLLEFKGKKKYSEHIPTLKGYNDKFYFWRYADIDIAVSGNEFNDQLNVYYLARAIEILKNRYPKAYQKLFVEVRSFPVEPSVFGSSKHRFANLVFSFNKDPSYIASGKTHRETFNNQPSNNISLVSFHKKNIQGNERYGSKQIYKSVPDDNYMRYLREGLIESMVHEMIHRYVDYQQSHDKIFNTMYNFRNSGSDENQSAEEAIVASTTLNYFSETGGLQPNIDTYYRNILKNNIEVLEKRENISLLSTYQNLLDPQNRSTDNSERLRLSILD
jgi:hypothetical protein